jgi:predicted ATPase
VLAHHFTQAGLNEAAIEWWGKAGEQALRRSAFQEAISHLGKAIETADKTGEGTSAASTNQRLKIQTNLGKALMWSRGFGADESRVAFSRARELAAAIQDATERFTTTCRAARWGLRGRLRRHFRARQNAVHGRRSVGLAAAYWDTRVSGRVILSKRNRI